VLVDLVGLGGHLHGESVKRVGGCGGKTSGGGGRSGRRRLRPRGGWRDGRRTRCWRFKFRINAGQAADEAVGAVQVPNPLVGANQGGLRGVQWMMVPRPVGARPRMRLPNHAPGVFQGPVASSRRGAREGGGIHSLPQGSPFVASHMP